MESIDEHRDLLEAVVSDIATDRVTVTWLASKGWAAHARLEGPTGLVGFILTSPECQEARFSKPRRSSFILTTTDCDDVEDALGRLARAVLAYISGNYEVESKRGLFGKRTVLVVQTPDGVWHIGKRWGQPPRPPN